MGVSGRLASAPVLMTSVVEIEPTAGPDKLVALPAGERVAMGMRDELAEHYGAAPGSFAPRSSTLDYLVGATAACLTGTFKRALAARGVAISPDQLRATAVGEIVADGDVPVLRRIEVTYRLTGTAPADAERVERAHAVHHRGCAASRSLEAAIEIVTALEPGD